MSTGKLPRPYNPTLVDKQIADRFKGQLMLARGLWEMQSLAELEAIFALPSQPAGTEQDCEPQP